MYSIFSLVLKLASRSRILCIFTDSHKIYFTYYLNKNSVQFLDLFGVSTDNHSKIAKVLLKSFHSAKKIILRLKQYSTFL